MVAKKKAAEAAELPLDAHKGPAAGEGIGSEFQRFTEAEAEKEAEAAKVKALEQGEWDQAAPKAEEPPAEADKPKSGWGRKKAAEAPSADDNAAVSLSNVKGSLVSAVERVERLLEERGAINEDIKEVFAELRGMGYNLKIVREVMKRRNWGPEAIKEHDTLLDLYEEALR